MKFMPHRTTRQTAIRFFSAATALAILLTACNNSPQPQPRPVVTILAGPAATEQATQQATQAAQATDNAPTEAATAAATAAPTDGPTPTPRPLGSPILLDREPVSGAELPLDQPLTLTFDQPMDKASVEGAISVAADGQPVAGTFAWSGDNAVAFTPANGWTRASAYAVVLTNTAKSAKGLGLARPEQFTVNTIGDLAVAQTIPADGAQDVTADSALTVLFNRPVVSLTLLGQQADLPTPVVFDPPIEGRGEWLNTSIYVFRPSQPLAGGTQYRGTVAAGLQDTTGAMLQSPYEWTFSAAAPTVKTSAPSEAAFDIGLRQPISITFSQKMDHASAEAAFTIEPAVPGHFVWAAETVEPANAGRMDPVGVPPRTVDLGEVMAFVPDEPYQRQTPYSVRISTGAKAMIGGAALRSEFGLRFNTVSNVGILKTTPQNGEDRANVQDGFRIQFQAPVDPATIIPNITFEPAISLTRAYTYYSDYDKSFFINTTLKPSTNYTITLGKGIADAYGQTLTEPVVIKFTTAPNPPFAFLRTDSQIGTYNANLPTQLFVAYQNVTKLDFTLSQLTLDDFGKFAGPNSYDAFDKFVPSDAQVMRRWSAPTITSLNETGLYRAQLGEDGGSLEPGVYLLTVSAPELIKLDKNYKPQKHVLVVSALHITLKRGEREALAWVTGLGSGEAQGGVPISFRDKNFTEIAAATTGGAGDDFGQALLQFPENFRPNPYDPIFAVVAQPGDPTFGIVHSEMANGINTYDFNLPSRYSNDPYFAYLYTDRPIYRPGQMVYYKGIVRNDNDARYSVPTAFQQVAVTVFNPQGQQVFSNTVPLTNGDFSGQFVLDNAAATGSYFIQACLPLPVTASSSISSTSTSTTTSTNPQPPSPDSQCSFYSVPFLVATYRAPEFEVDLTTDKEDYKAGDTISATLEAKYFFGGNVQNAAVKWTLLARDYVFDRYTGPGFFSFFDDDASRIAPNPGYNELVANGEGTTDANGRLSIQVPASFKNRGSVRISLEVSVTDLNDQSVSARSEAIVHKGDFYFGVSPESYVGAVGQTLSATVLSVDWQGQPLPNQAGTVTFYRREWFTAQEEDQFGQLIFNSVPSDTEVFSTSIATGAGATTTVAFTPNDGGEFRIVARSSDGSVVGASSVYVSNEGSYVAWQVTNNDRITLQADKDLYQVGDVARVLVPTPYQGNNLALLTIERGNFLQRKTITLQTNSDVLEIPIDESFAPNAYVSVLVLSPPSADGTSSFKLGYASFKVDPKAFALNVQITPNKTQFQPRDTATYDIRVTDSAGNPVQAEVSVALVDKAVLSLAAPNSGPLLDSFYGLRGLSVRTADTLSVNVDRITRQVAEANNKGGGGGGEASADANFVRSNFKDTAYWQAVLNTDAQGMARFSVILPDNLTTWSLDARAVTADTKVGEGTNKVLSTKQLLVRPVTPRFLVVGDEAVLGAVVNNSTDQDLQTDVTLQTAAGVQVLAGNPTQQVLVKANGSARVDWTIKATDAISADLTFTAQSGGLIDSAQPGLATAEGGGIPILRYAAPETVGTTGDVSEPGQKIEVIALPPRLQTGMGQLDLQVDTSLAAASAAGLKALEGNETESTDWVAMRLTANVAYARFLSKTGVGDAATNKANLDSLITQALQRLYADQHGDGGWGWWIGDDSNPTLTAMVVAAMAQAQQLGYTIDTNVLQRAGEFINSKLGAVSTFGTGDANRQAYITFALTEVGMPNSGFLGALFENRAKLSHYAKALLAMSLAKLNPEDARLATLLSDIQSAAVTSATGVHWDEATPDYENFYATTRSTSIILEMYTRLDPQNALVPNIVRWLMMARSGTAWESVQDTAWATTALADWMVASGETDTNYAWRVTLNDASVLNGQASKDNMATPNDLSIQVARLLQNQANTLAFERGAGTGRLYYTARLTAYLPVEAVKAENRGIVVARKYERADCTPTKEAACPAISSAKVGENVRVRLTVVAPSRLYYVQLNDPLPAGMEAVDTSLRTSESVGSAGPILNEFGGVNGWGWWWFSHTELRDDHAALFATQLPAGTYEYTYVMRASIAGNFKVMPTTIEQTYAPEVFGRSDGVLFAVTK